MAECFPEKFYGEIDGLKTFTRYCQVTKYAHPTLGDFGQGYCMSIITVDDKFIIKPCAAPHYNYSMSMYPNTV